VVKISSPKFMSNRFTHPWVHLNVDSYISGCLRHFERISDDEQRPQKEVELMPTLLSTTVRHIYDRVPNSVNSKLIEDFHSYMKDNATSGFLLHKK
jgi:hypothetical protein